MLDIRFIVENQDLVARNARVRGYDVDIDHVVELDKRRRALITRLDNLRKESNEIARDAKNAPDAEAARRERARELKREITDLEAEQREIQREYEELMARIPNMLDPRVPIGSEDQYTVLREWGEIRTFGFDPLPHEVLAERLNLLNIQQGVRTAGSRFYVLKNQAVRLRYAMIQLFQDAVAGPDWELVCPPFLAKDETLFTAGYLPFAEKDNYRLANENLSLIGTSEQAILGLHMQDILTKLPILYLGDSMCFRTEAGSAGRDVRGIMRVHQFYKLEQIVFCLPEDSEHWHLRCLENEEQFLQLLEIPYRVIICSSGDMAAPGHFKYDVEAWMPSQRRNREVTSDTNLTDFQTRRGNVRFKTEEGRRGFPHTISATGFTDRHILALLENHQIQSGAVRLPEALHRYMGGVTEISSA